MSVEEILKEIANVGFPIVVAIYLLVVFGSKLDRLSDAVEKLSRYVEGLNNRRDSDYREVKK